VFQRKELNMMRRCVTKLAIVTGTGRALLGSDHGKLHQGSSLPTSPSQFDEVLKRCRPQDAANWTADLSIITTKFRITTIDEWAALPSRSKDIMEDAGLPRVVIAALDEHVTSEIVKSLENGVWPVAWVGVSPEKWPFAKPSSPLPRVVIAALDEHVTSEIVKSLENGVWPVAWVGVSSPEKWPSAKPSSPLPPVAITALDEHVTAYVSPESIIERNIAAGLYHPSQPTKRAKAANSLYNRKEQQKAIIEYLTTVQTGKMTPVQDPKKQILVEKFDIIGSSGMKGIGKTEILAQICAFWGAEAVTGAKTVYTTYNGAPGAGPYCTITAANTDQEYLDRFGWLLLDSCGVKEHLAKQVSFDTALTLIRKIAKVGDKEMLIVCVDEIGQLGNDVTKKLMHVLMQKQDAGKGTLAFIFTHIIQTVLSQAASDSGRKVRSLPLPLLNLDVWKETTEWKSAGETYVGLHQLFLSCAGLPRAIFEGIPAAIKNDPTLLTHPNTAALHLASNVIIHSCKFDALMTERIGEAVAKWFDFTTPMQDQDALVRDGLMHTVYDKDNNAIQFLSQLVVQAWARKNSAANTIAFHLSQMYGADAIVGADAEKYMESEMYHFEAVVRKAVEGKKFTLEDFYKSKHIGTKFQTFIVTAPCPASLELVRFVDNFGDIDKVLSLLNLGFIVVSRAHREVGIEYFAPFRDTTTGKIIVACVQCKFLTDAAQWTKMKEKMETATTQFKKKKIKFFPVYYTTAKPEMQVSTFEDGVYFDETDIFRFTCKCGILRLHKEKMGKNLSGNFPFLVAYTSEKGEKR